MISNPNIVENPGTDRQNNTTDMTNIFVEMRALGINPNPLLEITARDLFTQYGPNAVDISIKIEKNFFNGGDFQSAEIWQEISQYLKNLNSLGTIATH